MAKNYTVKIKEHKQLYEKVIASLVKEQVQGSFQVDGCFLE